MPDDDRGLDAGGTGATAYAEAVSVYLAFAVRQGDRLLVHHLARWDQIKPKTNASAHFGAASIPMAWDFAEVNPLAILAGISEVHSSTGMRRHCQLSSCHLSCSMHSAKMHGPEQSAVANSFRLIRLITTTSATPIFRTSSTSGFVDRFASVFPDFSPRWRCQRPRNCRDAISPRQQGEGGEVLS